MKKPPPSNEQLLADVYALMTLYHSTGGENWTNNEGWLTRSPCGWYGITCSPFDYVIGINLTTNNLQGSLPPELAFIAPVPRPRRIPQRQLGDGNRDGSGPGDGGGNRDGSGPGDRSGSRDGPPRSKRPPGPNMTQGLLLVDLSGNQLKGNLPSSLGECSSMQWFDVGNNSLSGPIPNSISNWTRVKKASFRDNKELNGSFPSSLCSNEAGIVQMLSDVMLEVRFSVDCDNVSCECCNPSCNPSSNTTTPTSEEEQPAEGTDATPPIASGTAPSFGGQIMMSPGEELPTDGNHLQEPLGRRQRRLRGHGTK